VNGRLSKEARPLEIARFAVCDFHEEAGKIAKALAKLRLLGIAEPHHRALEASLATLGHALETWHEAEGRSIAEFNRWAPL
jgi:hypothetical protein